MKRTYEHEIRPSTTGRPEVMVTAGWKPLDEVSVIWTGHWIQMEVKGYWVSGSGRPCVCGAGGLMQEPHVPTDLFSGGTVN